MKSWKASLILIGRYPGWYAASVLVFWGPVFFVGVGIPLATRSLLNRLSAGPVTLGNAWVWIVLIMAIRLSRSLVEAPSSYIFRNHAGRVLTLLRSNLLRGFLRRMGRQPMTGTGGVGDVVNRLRDDVGPLNDLATDELVDAAGRFARAPTGRRCPT